MSKTLNKYIAVFDYADRTFLVLPATNGVVSIASFTTVITAPVRITSTSLGLIFSFSNGIAKKKKIIKIKNEKKEKETQLNRFISKK